VLSIIERKLMLEALKLRTDLDASIASGVPNVETVQSCFNNYARYFRLALPYLAEKDSIKEDLKPVTKEEISKWKEFLAAKKKSLDKAS
jgi:hypothetical protein